MASTVTAAINYVFLDAPTAETLKPASIPTQESEKFSLSNRRRRFKGERTLSQPRRI